MSIDTKPASDADIFFLLIATIVMLLFLVGCQPDRDHSEPCADFKHTPAWCNP